MTDGSTQSQGFPHAIRERLSIIIVGASLGGLAAALALKRLPAPHAHTITLLERNPTALLHNQGAGIAAGGDTLAFFKRYDRCKRDLAVTSTQRQYLNKHGQVIHKQDVTLNMTSWDLAYHMLRANVDGIESDYCDTPHDQDSGSKITHLHGHKVVELQDKGNKAVVKYETSEGITGEMEADLVIGADGPSSTVRSLLTTGIERTYAGYVALRGTVPKNSVSPNTLETFKERSTVFHANGIQILAYLIPGENGTLEPGKRLINFVYYTNFPSPSLTDPSPDFRELMTDVNGRYHRITTPHHHEPMQMCFRHPNTITPRLSSQMPVRHKATCVLGD